MAIRAEDLPSDNLDEGKAGHVLGSWTPDRPWWPDEPKTKEEIVDLALRQMWKMLSSPRTKAELRMKIFTIAARWAEKTEVDSRQRDEIVKLLKKTGKSFEPENEEKSESTA